MSARPSTSASSSRGKSGQSSAGGDPGGKGRRRHEAKSENISLRKVMEMVELMLNQHAKAENIHQIFTFGENNQQSLLTALHQLRRDLDLERHRNKLYVLNMLLEHFSGNTRNPDIAIPTCGPTDLKQTFQSHYDTKFKKCSAAGRQRAEHLAKAHAMQKVAQVVQEDFERAEHGEYAHLVDKIANPSEPIGPPDATFREQYEANKDFRKQVQHRQRAYILSNDNERLARLGAQIGMLECGNALDGIPKECSHHHIVQQIASMSQAAAASAGPKMDPLSFPDMASLRIGGVQPASTSQAQGGSTGPKMDPISFPDMASLKIGGVQPASTSQAQGGSTGPKMDPISFPDMASLRIGGVQPASTSQAQGGSTGHRVSTAADRAQVGLQRPAFRGQSSREQSPQAGQQARPLRGQSSREQSPQAGQQARPLRGQGGGEQVSEANQQRGSTARQRGPSRKPT